jgi:hypothetical protein
MGRKVNSLLRNSKERGAMHRGNGGCSFSWGKAANLHSDMKQDSINPIKAMPS